ncbi:MAG: D-Ala-D-Ala carboxypeptidase family metallohydrolase [Tannerellaceae bacterium]|nr:D-Ala-D-Ala carboxypeptidase family metallohydrolase [Tannerellaceae bacterium]
MKNMNSPDYISPPIDHGGFTWQEFTHSDTARKYGIPNEPTGQVKESIRVLVAHLLQPLRLLYGKPVRITSGYRSPEVNRLVKGTTRSQHIKGEAADLAIPEGPDHLLDLLVTSGLDFDQVIVYRKRHILHLSYKAEETNRQQILYR